MSSANNKWLLPDGVEELLPQQAWLLEQCRREVVDTFRLNGYQLVQPPLLEFLDSLLTGAGSDLDLLTFKVTDQNSGRLMGVRADMTPQLSRIDAHVLNHQGPSRLCYVGSVLQTSDRSGFHSREPIQFGAELFGHAGEQADVEIIRLCLDVFHRLGIDKLHFDLGHVGIFRALIGQANLNQQQADQMLDICIRKSWPDMESFINNNQLDQLSAEAFMSLLSLEGVQVEVFEKAEQLFKKCTAKVYQEFNEFKNLVGLLNDYLPELKCSIDFLELRGINYHTGVVFSVYCDDYAHAIAKGGRYDDVGIAFGRARPATGFSADLRQCLNFSNINTKDNNNLIYAPFSVDLELKSFIHMLRENGEKVIIGLEQEDSQTYIRKVTNRDGQWTVTES